MYPSLHRDFQRAGLPAPYNADSVLASARALQRLARGGVPQLLLRGKNFGLMCAHENHADAAFFRCAATELGAHVAHIPPSLSELSTPEEIRLTASILGQLYDIVECQGMAPALVRQIGREAGVPVFDGVASAAHPTAALAELLKGSASAADKRRVVLQAVLSSVIYP